MSLGELASQVAKRRVILFAGAGVSMNLGLPSFRELTAHIAEELGFDPEIFETFGDYPQLAEYYELKRGSIGSLRSWMDTKWHSNDIDINISKIHSLVVELGFPIIYTTNYDRWLERAFENAKKKYLKVAKVADLATDASDLTEIVKFHGDFDQDDSIVLTEKSYYGRLEFESALDIKLRSDSLARPLLFIGYRLADMNIRYLLFKLQELWRGSLANQRPKSYILLTRRNPVQETLLAARGIETIVRSGDPQEALTHFLLELQDLVKQIVT